MGRIDNSFNILCSLLFISFLFACSNDENNSYAQPNQKLYGRWYYAEAPSSYIEIDSASYYEYLEEMESTLSCDLHWQDSLNFELKVKKVTGPIQRSLKVGEKIKVEIKNLTSHYYWFYIQRQGRNECVLMLRQKNYKGQIKKPC